MSLRPAPKHAPRVPFALLVLGLLVGAMIALLALNTASAANELRRHDLAAKDASIAASVEQLNNEVAASAAPGNLARVAAQLGMVPAGNPAFLQIDPDGQVRVLGSPGPATAPALPAPATRHKTPPPKKKTKATTTKVTGTAGRTTGSTKAAKHPTAHPTPDPTPTTTLPGGTR
ncbi:MAG: cell division protein FtsL [Jatrophihabitantaceae bacterium]